jgi:hypothetical protein
LIAARASDLIVWDDEPTISGDAAGALGQDGQAATADPTKNEPCQPQLPRLPWRSSGRRSLPAMDPHDDRLVETGNSSPTPTPMPATAGYGSMPSSPLTVVRTTSQRSRSSCCSVGARRFPARRVLRPSRSRGHFPDQRVRGEKPELHFSTARQRCFLSQPFSCIPGTQQRSTTGDQHPSTGQSAKEDGRVTRTGAGGCIGSTALLLNSGKGERRCRRLRSPTSRR